MTVDRLILNSNLVTHTDFRLGGRGICIDFRYMASLDKWTVSIPRAHFEINFIGLKLLGNSLYLNMDGVAASAIDLNDFDKLSRLIE